MTLALSPGGRFKVVLHRNNHSRPEHVFEVTEEGMAYALTGEALDALSYSGGAITGTHVGLIVGLGWAPALMLQVGEHWDLHDNSRLRVVIDQEQGAYAPGRFDLDETATTRDEKRDNK